MKNQSAMTAIAVSKSLLKEYQTREGRTVYLDGGSEFQIKLFNPTTDVIGAEVYVNETRIGAPIIINPGQIVWLERYLEEAKKFKFDVYEVDMNQEGVSEAIKNNGQIKVKFYKERQRDAYKPFVMINSKLDCIYPNNNTLGLDNTTLSTYCCDTKTTTNNSLLTFGGDIETLTASSFSSEPTGRNMTKMKNISCNIQDTGGVAKGGYSNQRFDYVDIDLCTYPFETEIIKILPKSQKPVFKEDLEKIYCYSCRRKLKSKFNFCPFCGAKQ